MDQAAILSPYGTMTASGSSSTGIPLDKTRVDPRVRPLGPMLDPRATNSQRPAPGIANLSCETRSRDQSKQTMQNIGVFSRAPIFISLHNSKIRENTAQATTVRRTYKCPAHDTTTNVAPRALRRAHMHAHRCKHMHAAPSQREGVQTAPKRGVACRGRRGRWAGRRPSRAAPPAESLRGRQRGCEVV